jgi:SAM-dependent methyltransferase
MNPSEVLGLALNSYYEGDASAKIIVHSPEFDPDEQSASYYFREYDKMPKLEQDALNHARGKVLDIGAAVGSHCLELQRRGFEVTGIELSAKACDIMRKRGVNNIINNDIFNPAPAKFDTLLMLMNGIGLVRTLEGLQVFLKHIKSYMNLGGQLIFDSANLIYLFQDEDTEEAVIDLNARYYGEMEFVMEYNGTRSDSFFWLYVDFDTLCYYAEKEGFKPELISQDQDFQYLARLHYSG